MHVEKLSKGDAFALIFAHLSYLQHPFSALGLVEDGVFLLQPSSGVAERQYEFVPFNRIGDLLETTSGLLLTANTVSTTH